MAKQVKPKQAPKKQATEKKVLKKRVSPFEFEDITESLTDRQKLFCMYYVGECKFNGTKSAEMAGYDKNNCASYAVYLLKNPNISQFIDSAKKDLGLRIGITAEMIAKEYAKIGFSNISNVLTVDNGVGSIKDLPLDISAAIKKIKVKQMNSEEGGDIIGTITEIEIIDKVTALDKLAKMINVDGVTKVASTDPEGNEQKPTMGPKEVAEVLKELRAK